MPLCVQVLALGTQCAFPSLDSAGEADQGEPLTLALSQQENLMLSLCLVLLSRSTQA